MARSKQSIKNVKVSMEIGLVETLFLLSADTVGQLTPV